MMQGMMGSTGDFNPAAMCQAMMTSVGKAAEMAAYATPEVRTLFEEWARSVEDVRVAGRGLRCESERNRGAEPHAKGSRS